MKNVIKNSFYATTWLMLTSLNSVFAADAGSVFWTNKVTVSWEERTLDVALQGYINNFALFLSLIAVWFALYGGFNILTAAWDEEKVKTGKTILIQAMLWLLVIFIANSIIKWFLGLLAG